MSIEFRSDPYGVTILLDGWPQSHVAPGDPGLLTFEYVHQIALVLDSLPAGRLAVTHVGGGGLTVPRYVHATRPGSPQIVFEPDAALTAAVREHAPLPRGHRIRVRPMAGAAGVAGLAAASADVLILDAYAAGRVPAELTSAGFAREVRRVLRGAGIVVANLADAPGLAFVRRCAATFAAAGLEPVALLATHDILKGRRFGNAVLVGGAHPDPAALDRGVGRASPPCGIRSGAEVARLLAGVAPFVEGELSPEPPPGLFGR